MTEASRILLWEAFSDLFLDTEMTDWHFSRIARAIDLSGLPVEAAEAILWNEVFPVLHTNLEAVAGEWAGWPREWLEAHLRPSSGPARRIGPTFAVREIQRCWEQVLGHLR